MRPVRKRLKETTMKYLLLIYANEANMQSRNKSETDQVHAAYGAYTEAMTNAGVIVGGERLRPTASASTVRVPTARPRCSMDLTPRPRSSSADTT